MNYTEYTIYLKNKQVIENCSLNGINYRPSDEEAMEFYFKIKDESYYKMFLMCKKRDISKQTVNLKFSQLRRIGKQEHKDYVMNINEIERIEEIKY